MSKPTPKLLRTTHHAARNLSNVLHASSLTHSAGSTSHASAATAQSAGRAGAAIATSASRVDRPGRQDVVGGGSGDPGISRDTFKTEKRAAASSTAVVHRQRTATSTFGLNTSPHTYPFYLPSHSAGPSTSTSYVPSSGYAAYFAANLSTTAYAAPLYLDPPPFPTKLTQPGFDPGAWAPPPRKPGYGSGSGPARSSSPEFVVAEESGSRQIDSLLPSRRSSYEVDAGIVYPAVPPHQGQGHPAGRSFGTSLAPSDARVSGAGTDLAGPSASLVQRKASGLVFHPGAYGLAKKRHQQRPSSSSRPASETADPHAFLSPPDERGQQTLLKSTQVGEDAYFLRPDSLGIADGVGGWSNTARRRRRHRAVAVADQDGEDGVALPEQEDEIYADPGMFARLLMGFCEDSLEGYWGRGDAEWLAASEEASDADASSTSGNSTRKKNGNQNLSFDHQSTASDPSAWAERIRLRAAEFDSSSSANTAASRARRPLSPVEVMQRGYERCMACVRAEGIEGSSTCLLAVLQDDELKIANLGDCACVVVRNGEIVFRTEDMQHSFNFPLQLGTNSRDEPMKDAELFTIKVEKHDIVVMSSDGLVDNLFDEDILDVLATFAPPSAPPSNLSNDSSRPTTPAGLPQFSPQKVSEALVHAAHAASEEAGTASPFMCRAIEEGIDFVGGKRDDISVLVAVVQDHAQA